MSGTRRVRVSNQGLSRDNDRSLRPRSEERSGADQPTQDLDDVTLPSLYPAPRQGLQPAVPPPVHYEPTSEANAPASASQGSSASAWFMINKFNQFLQWLLAVLEVWFLLRFFMLLIGASPSNAFASFLYSTSYPLLLPFHSILPSTHLIGSSVIEWSTLIGMLVYALVTVAVIRFLRLLVSEPAA